MTGARLFHEGRRAREGERWRVRYTCGLYLIEFGKAVCVLK